MAIIDTYLSYLLEVEGTDLLLAAGARPLMRVDGQLQIMKRRYVAASDVEYHALEVLGQERMYRLPEAKNIDFVYDANINGADRRFRGSVYYQKNGLNIILRAIPSRVANLADLGLSASVAALADLPSGLVLVAGPARSGKSSTLAALIEQINDQKLVHIVTVEDPVEFVFTGRKALISQRQIGLHAESFAAALEGVLREDPDVIMISDLRDLESIRLALRAAESGHLVLAGIQAGSALRTIERLIHAFPEDARAGARNVVARYLRAVVALQMVPRADTGRVPATEVLVATPKVASLIRTNQLAQIHEIMRRGQQGMRLMEDDLTSLAAEGIIHEDEAYGRIEACELARVGGP